MIWWGERMTQLLAISSPLLPAKAHPGQSSTAEASTGQCVHHGQLLILLCSPMLPRD